MLILFKRITVSVRFAFHRHNYSSASYIILALSSSVPNLPRQPNFNFPWLSMTDNIILHDLPGLENEILKFHDFPGFP